MAAAAWCCACVCDVALVVSCVPLRAAAALGWTCGRQEQSAAGGLQPLRINLSLLGLLLLLCCSHYRGRTGQLWLALLRLQL